MGELNNFEVELKKIFSYEDEEGKDITFKATINKEGEDREIGTVYDYKTALSEITITDLPDKPLTKGILIDKNSFAFTVDSEAESGTSSFGVVQMFNDNRTKLEQTKVFRLCDKGQKSHAVGIYQFDL